MAQIDVVDLLSNVTQICRECPSATLIRAYIDATRAFCQKSRWLRAAIPGATTADQPNYSLGSDAYHEVIGIKAASITISSTNAYPLTEGDPGLWNPLDATGEPELYAYIPNGQFALHDTPAGAYDLLVTAVIQPRRDAVSIDDRLVAKWHKTLEAGALAYLLSLPRMPWTDKVEYRLQDAMFNVDCARASAHEQRGYNPGADLTDRPGPPSGALRTKILPI